MTRNTDNDVLVILKPEQKRMLDEIVAARCASERRAVTRSEVIREAIDGLIKSEMMREENNG
jgi:Arc/MetJ-type ribon-helix-helix transcriptional regulator